ncbi:hypothetical protein DPV78_011443 [Talaromyces pinophilus]|nr:hypothetical protein DPV78_011443 [Talaromyces pinophilus]
MENQEVKTQDKTEQTMYTNLRSKVKLKMTHRESTCLASSQQIIEQLLHSEDFVASRGYTSLLTEERLVLVFFV